MYNLLTEWQTITKRITNQKLSYPVTVRNSSRYFIVQQIRAMSHLRFCRATLSRTLRLRLWRSVRHTNMASSDSDDAASKSKRATMRCDFVAQQNRRCDMALRTKLGERTFSFAEPHHSSLYQSPLTRTAAKLLQTNIESVFLYLRFQQIRC